MLQLMIGVILSILAFITSLVSCDMGGFMGKGGASWKDPAGDTPEVKTVISNGESFGTPVMDIVDVRAEGKEGNIIITATTNKPISDIFDYTDTIGKKHAGVRIKYYIDVDNSAATGGSPWGADSATRPMEGYDINVSVMLGYKTRYLEDGMESKGAGDILVDTSKEEVLGSYVTFAVWSMGEGIDRNSSKWENEDELTVAEKNRVEIRIPYDWLGLKPGDTVRLCFQEVDASGEPGGGFSEDKLLRLG